MCDTKETPAAEEELALQAARIARYEAILSEADAVLKDFEAALERFSGVQAKIADLNAYYGSEAWWADFDAAEAGQLPKGLPCGVLSEDGAWNLLVRNRELLEEAKVLSASAEEASAN